MTERKVIIGIDPGLAHTGIAVVVDPDTILHACTVRTEADGPTPSFTLAMSRARWVATEVVRLLEEYREAIDTVVIEGYEDFGGGHLRTARNRWTTPIVCALIGDALERRGYTVVWQSASVVMAQYREYKTRWKAGQRGLVGGDSELANDHERSAACHALAYLASAKREARREAVRGGSPLAARARMRPPAHEDGMRPGAGGRKGEQR